MRAWMKWLLGIVVLLVVLLAGAAYALSRWVGTDDFRVRAQQQASQALGVPVQLGRIDIDVFPTLSVAVRDVRLQTKPAMTLEQVEARPVWASLLEGKPELASLVVRNAVLPQQGLVALAAAAQKDSGKAAPGKGQGQGAEASAAPPMPRQIELKKVTWVDAKGQRLTVDADVAFEGAPLPQSARVHIVAGRFEGAKASLERQGQNAESWNLKAEIGGGTVSGPLRLQPLKGAGWRFTGELATNGVEVSALTAPSRSLTGRLEARTTLQSDFREPGQLADAMRTQTRFTVRGAMLHGIDLAQAVRTLGASRSGQTALDTLTGHVSTQGQAARLTNLVASSGALSATGDVALGADKSLNGKLQVSLTAGPLGSLAGVPVQVSGTLDSPSVIPTGVSLPGSGVASSVGEKAGKALGSLKGLFGK